MGKESSANSPVPGFFSEGTSYPILSISFNLNTDYFSEDLYLDPAHQFDHIQRVIVNGKLITATEGGDINIIALALLLHDCVPLKKDHSDVKKSASLSADRAIEILKECSISLEVRERVHHCIACHSFSSGLEPTTLEAKIVQDADRLDALGAIGIARLFSVSGSINRTLYDHDDPFADRRPFDDTKYALDHCFSKLLKLPDTMQTSAGVQIARERAKFIDQYIQHLSLELNYDDNFLSSVKALKVNEG